MYTFPLQLVLDGVLTTSIYRIAKVNARETDLCTGHSKDDFPEVLEYERNPGHFYLPDCAKSLANGDILTTDQWLTLRTWHAGLSCQMHLKQHGVVADRFDTGFHAHFNHARGTIKVSANEKYQQFLCYELPRGASILAGVGFERDGDNHVSFHPTGDHCAVSTVSRGQDIFVVDALRQTTHLWKPYALLKMKACGHPWPASFPPDSEHFPLRRWVQAVVMSGEADLAVTVASSVEDASSGVIGWVDFFQDCAQCGRALRSELQLRRLRHQRQPHDCRPVRPPLY
jgi:hypothetical protein